MATQGEVVFGRIRLRRSIIGTATSIVLAVILASCGFSETASGRASGTATPVPSMAAGSTLPDVPLVQQSPTARSGVTSLETASSPRRDTAIPAPTITPTDTLTEARPQARPAARLRLDADSSVVAGGEPLTVRLILEIGRASGRARVFYRG